MARSRRWPSSSAAGLLHERNTVAAPRSAEADSVGASCGACAGATQGWLYVTDEARAGVVTAAAALGAETLPKLSTAATVYVYAVDGVSPASRVESAGAATSLTGIPLRNTR